jgi:YVTN family beta-propeller protein
MRFALVFFLLAVAVSLVNAGTVRTEEYLSPTVLVANKAGDILYVAEAGARQVAAFDLASAKVTRTYSLPEQPTGLALSPDGSRLYVTCGSSEGQVIPLDPETGKAERKIPVGHTPNSPVVSPDGKTLYVCNRYNNNVSVIDLGSRRERARIPVLREPVAAAITLNGDFLLVANHLPSGAADLNYIAASVSVISASEGKTVRTIALPNGSTSLRGISISPDGKYAYGTHILGRYQLPTTQLERGWMNTNALTIIGLDKLERINTVLLDDIDSGAANPWGVACTDDGKFICVAHAGTHEISVIDRAALHEKLEKVAKGEKVSEVSVSAEDVPNDLSFLAGLRRRLKLKGNGPHGLAVVGEKAYVAEYFTDTLGVVNISPEVRPKAESFALGPPKAMSVSRRGEMLFNDARVCFQQWQSCASCHPDARSDSLNWDLLNDGIGNPKQSKSMLFSHKTPPAMATGIRADAETAVRAGMRNIQCTVRPEEDAVALDTYLTSIQPVPSPYLVKGKLSASAKRGKKIFEKAGCAKCHPSPLYTNIRRYNVGTGIGLEENREFDTPTLAEVWRTAPYLYDGRAATINDVLTKDNSKDSHGTTSGLSEKEIDDLSEYVLSE